MVKWLLQNGHDATHLRDQGLQRMPNGEIFEKAIREDRIVITRRGMLLWQTRYPKGINLKP